MSGLATAGNEDSALFAAKAAMRRTAAERRDAARAAGDGDAAARVAGHFLAKIADQDFFAPDAVASAYWPIRSELDPRPILDILHDRGHRCALPTVRGHSAPLTFRAWQPGSPLVEGAFGVMEPPADAQELEPNLLIVPLLAFDLSGYRLGYGAGFYDRSLHGLRARGRTLAVGVAYAAQAVDTVPHDDSDERLDWLVTEAVAHRFA